MALASILIKICFHKLRKNSTKFRKLLKVIKSKFELKFIEIRSVESLIKRNE